MLEVHTCKSVDVSSLWISRWISGNAPEAGYAITHKAASFAAIENRLADDGSSPRMLAGSFHEVYGGSMVMSRHTLCGHPYCRLIKEFLQVRLLVVTHTLFDMINTLTLSAKHSLCHRWRFLFMLEHSSVLWRALTLVDCYIIVCLAYFSHEE